VVSLHDQIIDLVSLAFFAFRFSSTFFKVLPVSKSFTTGE
jgi:hypothetical protein